MTGEFPDFEDYSRTRTFEWDQSVAEALVGRTVVIGFTVFTSDEQFLRQEQFIGTVTHVDRSKGIAVWLRGTDPPEYKILPPAPYCFVPAQPGTYRMRSTGESIENPDLLSDSWRVNEPPERGGDTSPEPRH
jgi:hypothetical protein